MKKSPASIPHRAGFTLIELLVVISIIGILAAMLLPALGRAKVQAQKNRAKLEIGQIVGAIRNYDAAYSRFPVSPAALNAAGTGDYTWGGTLKTPAGTTAVAGPGPVLPNAEIVAVLMALERYPNGTPTINADNIKNPQRTRFLNANFASDSASPGVGKDGVFRDPWGDPYIITIDLNADEKARDVFYGLPAVSTGGLNGFVPVTTPAGQRFECNASVMVWSAGPDGTVDPSRRGDQGANQDNILSWRE